MVFTVGDIAVAFVLSTVAALSLGYLIDAGAASTAFGVVFPSVIAVFEKRDRTKGRQRAAERRSEGERRSSTSGAAQPQVTSDGSPSPQAEGSVEQDDLAVPGQADGRAGVDWRRVATGALLSVLVIGAAHIFLVPIAAILVILEVVPPAVLIAPTLLSALTMFVMGLWVSKRSEASGVLTATVAGSIVGVGVPVVLLVFAGLDRDLANVAWAFTVFTATGVVMASIGGWVGVRQRQRDAG